MLAEGLDGPDTILIASMPLPLNRVQHVHNAHRFRDSVAPALQRLTLRLHRCRVGWAEQILLALRHPRARRLPPPRQPRLQRCLAGSALGSLHASALCQGAIVGSEVQHISLSVAGNARHTREPACTGKKRTTGFSAKCARGMKARIEQSPRAACKS